MEGILVIVETSRRDISTTRLDDTTRGDVSTTACVDATTGQRLMAGSLGAIMGQIKSVCTKWIWAAGYTDFGWQSCFHDHIIRDEGSLRRIRQHIANNPKTWTEDRYYRP